LSSVSCENQLSPPASRACAYVRTAGLNARTIDQGRIGWNKTRNIVSHFPLQTHLGGYYYSFAFLHYYIMSLGRVVFLGDKLEVHGSVGSAQKKMMHACTYLPRLLLKDQPQCSRVGMNCFKTEDVTRMPLARFLRTSSGTQKGVPVKFKHTKPSK